VHGVEYDEVAEAALRSLLLPARHDAKEALVVPRPVLVLPQHDVRMLDGDAAKEQPAVHEVARIVLKRDPACRDEQRVLVVAQLERVDRDAGEEIPPHAADVHLAADVRRDLSLKPTANTGLTGLGPRREESNAHDDRPERDEHAQAHEGDEVASGHSRGMQARLRSPGRLRT
jgi:hypothetical protein